MSGFLKDFLELTKYIGVKHYSRVNNWIVSAWRVVRNQWSRGRRGSPTSPFTRSPWRPWTIRCHPTIQALTRKSSRCGTATFATSISTSPSWHDLNPITKRVTHTTFVDEYGIRILEVAIRIPWSTGCRQAESTALPKKTTFIPRFPTVKKSS